MKNLKLLFLGLGISLLSCNSSDDNSANIIIPPVNTSLVGKWEFDKSIHNGVETDLTAEPGCARNYLEFTDSGIQHEIHHENFPSPCYEHVYANNYTFENDIITIIYGPNSTFEMNVISINSTQLKVSTYNGDYIKTYKRIN